jgi:hypothetical protein
MFEYKKIFFKKSSWVSWQKHKHMKVVDALGQIYWYSTMCHLLKGFSPKFQILSWNTIAY